MVKQQKIDEVNELTDQLQKHPDVVFTNFRGLTVHEMEDFRRNLYEKQSRYRVVKNRLALLAFERALVEPSEPDTTETETPPETEEPVVEAPDLSEVSGVGPSKLESLNEAGIMTVKDLLDASEETLTSISGIGAATAEKLQSRARELLEEYSVEEPEAAEESEESSESEDSPEVSGSARVDEEQLERIQELLTGNTGLVFSGNGFVSTAKVLVDFAEEHENLKVKAGLLNGQLLDFSEIEEISELPSRRELLTKLAQGLHNPIQRLANGLQYPIHRFIKVLSRVKEQKEENE